MAIDLEEVKKIAHLARLKISSTDLEIMSRELAVILEYVEKLNEVDTQNVLPLYHPSDLKNIFRKDKYESSLSVEKALENAPEKSGNYFKVPKVIIK